MRHLKERKIAKDNIVHYLEIECCFRDYRILPKKLFGKVNRIGIHHCFSLVSDGITHEGEVDDSIDTFCKDGYPVIYFYI